MSLNVFILSPHVDDAAFGLTLHISGFIKSKSSVSLINCFTVSRWTAVPVLSKEVDDVMVLRANEDLAYNNLFDSAIRITNLNLLDAPLRNGYIFHFKPLEENEWKLVEQLREYLEKNVDGILLCPLGIGDHIDHTICREAVMQLYRRLNVIFYEDLPYAARISSVEIVSRVETLAERLQVPLRHQVYDLQNCSIDKEMAIRLYKSQMNDDICSEILEHMRAVAGERVWGETEKLGKLKEALAC